MLVLISDLHMNDGSMGPLLEPGAIDLVSDRLCDLAYRASWRAGGSYQPIERIDLVLLGDVLDLIHSQRWLAGAARPWNDPASPLVGETAAQIVDDILRRNVEAIRRLRLVATEPTITVPQADASGQPLVGDDELPVAVRTHYLVGNHDWLLHLRGQQYDFIRHKVAHHLGLANLHNRPFPHEAAESDELLDSLRRHRTLARHGDIYDPLACSDDRDAASLADAIAIELVGRFLAQIDPDLAADLPPAAMAGLREIDQIRPLLLIPAWIDRLLARTVPSLALRKEVRQLWDSLVDDPLLQLEIVRDRHRHSATNLIDGLAAALKFSRRDSTDWTGKTLRWLASLRGAAGESYVNHALSEPDFRNRRARHIVYGHTHQAEIVPLDASHADGYVLHQTYFNAGTLRRVYRATQALGQQEFTAAETLSLVAVYQGDERSGRPYEIWSATLAPGATEPAAVRPPAPVAQGAHALRAPHFSAHPAARASQLRRG
jgi:UDP-2,3-diacylglucosamine pyrophosphatase LpxH